MSCTGSTWEEELSIRNRSAPLNSEKQTELGQCRDDTSTLPCG